MWKCVAFFFLFTGCCAGITPIRQVKTLSINMDENLKLDSDCVFKRWCDDVEPLGFKATVDPVLNKTLMKGLDILMPILDESDTYEEYATLECIRSEKTWVEVYQPIVCGISEEKQKRYGAAIMEKMVDFMMELCPEGKTDEECDGLKTGIKNYQLLMTDLRASGKC